MAESDKQESQRLTGFDLFHDEMVKMLPENSLQRKETLVKLLEDFFALDEELRKRIDKLASTGHRTLPRPLCEQLQKIFFNPTAQQSQPVSNGQQSQAASIQSPSGSTAVQQPGSASDVGLLASAPPVICAARQRPGGASGAGLLAPASAFLCAGSWLDNGVFGRDNFVALKHPAIPNVYLRLPIAAMTQTDMEPTAVPIIYDHLSQQAIPLNGQALSSPPAANTVSQGPRMTLMIATLGQCSAIMSDMIKVAGGIIYIYDIASSSWKYLWG